MTWAYRVWAGTLPTIAQLRSAKNLIDDLAEAGLIKRIRYVDAFGLHLWPVEVTNGYLAPVKGRLGAKRGASFDLHIGGKTYVIPYKQAFNDRLPMKPGEQVDFDAPLWLLKDRGITE